MSHPVTDAMRKMELLQLKHSKYGAQDTEPDWEWQGVIADHFAGRDYRIPETASEWQLFDGMKGVKAAAKEMTAQLKRCLKAIDKAPHKGLVDTINSSLTRTQV